MRYTSDHKAETRAKVLKVAAREIRAKGPEGVAVAGIMAQVGLTHGGFYAHFPSKEDRKSTRLNSSHIQKSRMPSSA